MQRKTHNPCQLARPKYQFQEPCVHSPNVVPKRDRGDHRHGQLDQGFKRTNEQKRTSWAHGPRMGVSTRTSASQLKFRMASKREAICPCGTSTTSRENAGLFIP